MTISSEDKDALIEGITRSYGVEPTGRDTGSLESIIAYVESVIGEHVVLSMDKNAHNVHLGDAERRRRMAGALTWSILSRLNLRGVVVESRAEMHAAGYAKAANDLQAELDDIATNIGDIHKIPGDGARGYVRGLRFAAQRARELRHE